MHTSLRAAVAVGCAAAIVAAAVLGGSYLSLAAPLSGDVYETVARGGVGPDTESVESPYGRATVRYDGDGVPHVSAENERALYYAVGYVQARDRLFQMDLQRRLVGGNLSAAFGERAVSSDRFHRKLDFRGAAEASWRSLRDTEVGPALEAYSEGVNRYAETGALPPEFELLGYEPTEWTPVDTLLVGKLVSWRLSGNFADLRRATVASRLGREAASDLYPARLGHDAPVIRESSDAAPFDPEAVATAGRNAAVDGDDARNATDFGALYESVAPFDAHPGVGSNNWVLSGEATASGRPILANDPHLSLTVPGVWYEMHATAGSMDVRGVTFPGVPFVVVGRTADVAWGVTNVGGDFTDLYTYETRNGSYRYDGEYREFETTTETIPVADAPDVTVEVRKTVHGPVIERSGREVGVAWPGFSATNESLGVYRLNRAESMGDVRDALRIWDVPAQNFVAATRAGETLYYPAGRYPLRVTDGEVVRGDRVFDGSAGAGEWPGYEPYAVSSWDGFVPFASVPHVDDPDVLATANQRLVGDPPFYLGTSQTFADPYRGDRIYELLDDHRADGGVTADEVRDVQRDVRSTAGVAFADVALGARDEMSPAARELASELDGWNGSMRAESRAALVARLFRQEYRDVTFGDEFRAHGLDDAYYPRDYVLQTLPSDSRWFDDVDTAAVETRADVAATAMNRTAARIDRQGYETYGDYNRLDLNHPFGRAFLDWPERPMDGGPDTVFNYRNRGDPVGSSWRMVVAFGETPAGDDARGVIPGGQSGVFWSPHYHDQLGEWATGEYKPLTLDAPDGRPDIVFERGGDAA
jgi:penicillin amidase